MDTQTSNGVNKKIIMAVVAVGIIAAVIIVALNNKKSAPGTGVVGNNQNKIIENAAPTATADNQEPVIKEFTMTSFVEFVDDQPKPQFSLKEITVNQGDRVRIKITVTGGTHDFKIDEFGVYADTQLNQEATVEFIADQAGEFIYYCTKPGHRQNGHWGTLKVLDK